LRSTLIASLAVSVIGYTGGIVALGLVVAWGALVLPWS
jgi:hypothetical protein